MKQFLALCMVVLSVTIALGADAPVKRGRPRGSAAASCGIVEKPYSGNVFRIANCQDKIPLDKISPVVQQMRWTALLPIEVVNRPTAEAPMAMAEKLVAEDNVGAGVVVVDKEDIPITLVAPERRWTIFNIAPLTADNPSLEKLQERFNKMLWCAVARTLGAGYSSYKPCVLVPFKDLASLDRNPATRPCPEPFNKMIDTGAEYGIKTISIASYRDACRKGWAPTPTNDVQKAIWDEVHAIPATPMKIEFDPKKGR